MNHTKALRLYFPHSAKAKPTRLWHHLSAPSLGHRLIQAAHKAGIHQAVLHSVHAGYLKGRKPTHHHPDTSSRHHPLCLELIDIEEKLKYFVQSHQTELRNVKVVFLHCDEIA